MAAISGERSWRSRTARALVALGLTGTLLAVPAYEASACSIQIVELDELEAALADPSNRTFAGVVEAGVVHVWPETETFRTARATGLKSVWGEGPDEYGWIVGGELHAPTTTSSCGTPLAERRTSWLMAVYASDADRRPILLSPQPAFDEIAPLLEQRFGDPRVVPPPEFSEAHPSEPIIVDGDGDLPLSGTTTASLRPPEPDPATDRTVGLIVAAGLVVAALLLWIRQTHRVRPGDPLDPP